VEI
jgi:predicted pyridoxine 5'-phosphate oxidase superfamily flavin-nucleotide-binding protein